MPTPPTASRASSIPVLAALLVVASCSSGPTPQARAVLQQAESDAPAPATRSPRSARPDDGLEQVQVRTSTGTLATLAQPGPFATRTATQSQPPEMTPVASSWSDPGPPPSSVLPGAVEGMPDEQGLSRSPAFSMFGELPSGHAGGERHRTIPDATENIRRITVSEVGADFDPTTSPDGRRIFFASTRHRPTADIYSQAIGGSAVTQITNDPAHDVMPAVSPDGTRVAFASNRNGSWDIYVAGVEGGQAVQVTSDTSHELHPSWSPDGDTITYCRLGETSDRWEVWLVELDRPVGGKFLTYGLFPEWQPGGNKILFQRSRDRDDRLFSVWTIDMEAGEAIAPTEIASSATAAIINPTWARDGSYIAYATVYLQSENDYGAKPTLADIWIQRLDGSARTNLTGGWFANLMPTWAADNRIYFISDRGGTDNIWSIGPEQAITAAGAPMPRTTVDLATAPIETEPADNP